MFARRSEHSDNGTTRLRGSLMSSVDLSQCKRMVTWFRPTLLFRAAFHSVIASIFGRYADQRTIHQLEDEIPSDTEGQQKFATRYDYTSSVLDGEPFWADYTADLGDGFDSTYAVSYLMSAKSLSGRANPQQQHITGVEGLSPDVDLKHGKILIMGGDQVYPWPSREAYGDKLQRPYAWSLPPKPEQAADPGGGEPKEELDREVYAIPGNHDWYDGLGAFDGLFCRARGGSTEDNGSIGGWKTRQHRSYFAIKLPYNWWIWGADISLNQYLDAGQLRYFRTVCEHMQPGDKFILCTAQPTWLYFGKPGERYARANLLSLINAPIRQKSAKLCGIFSGDTHHYSRYNEKEELGDFNLFTAGGGGAYFHGTHHLNNSISFDWLGRKLSFLLTDNRKPQPASRGAQPDPKKTNQRACYPDRAQSCWRAMTNLMFPWKNFSFAMAMGLIYWLLTWSLAELNVSPQFQMEEGAKEQVIEETVNFRQERQQTIQKMRGIKLPQKKNLERRLPGAPSDDARPERPPEPLPPADVAEEKKGAKPIRDLTMGFWRVYLKKQKEITSTNPDLKWYASERLSLFGTFVLYMGGLLVLGLASSPGTTIWVFLVWLTFFVIADSKRVGRGAQISRLISGTIHFLLHLILMWSLFIIFTYINEQYIFDLFVRLSDWLRQFTGGKEGFLMFLPIEIWPRIIYIPEMIVVGGLLAGLVFGLYLALTYVLVRVNSDWAFSAQASPDFRNFLRLKFEKDKLTVYPIGLDRPPRHQRGIVTGQISGWVPEDNPAPGEPLVRPRRPLKPRLIEGPIVIDANKVRNIPRR